MEINPIAAMWQMENPREISCPGCKAALVEITNPYYNGTALETPTMFFCNDCQLWICGCCGAVYPKKGEPYLVALTKTPAWEDEVKRFKDFVLAGEGGEA